VEECGELDIQTPGRGREGGMGHLLYVAGRLWAFVGLVYLVMVLFTSHGSMRVVMVFICLLGFVAPGFGISAIGSAIKRKAAKGVA